MYAAHFAAGLAIKAAEPRAPVAGLLLGAALADIVFGALLLLGLERCHMTPGQAPGFALDDIAWSHSVVAMLAWAALYAALFAGRGARVALAMGAAVLSHWLLDWPMHPGDMRLYPGSEVPLGLGIWRLYPVGWWWIELAVVAALLAPYLVRAARTPGLAGHPRWVAAVVLLVHVTNHPAISPVR